MIEVKVKWKRFFRHLWGVFSNTYGDKVDRGQTVTSINALDKKNKEIDELKKEINRLNSDRTDHLEYIRFLQNHYGADK